MSRKWTEAKDTILRTSPGADDAALAERLGVSPRAVAERRRRLGLRKNAPTIWTPEIVAELKRLDAEGLSAAQVARHLGAFARAAFSRNMIISKLHRLGITNPDRAPGRMTNSTVNQYGPQASRGLRAPPRPPKPTPAARAFLHGGGCSITGEPKAPSRIKTTGPTAQSKNLRLDASGGHRGCRWPTLFVDGEHAFCCAPVERGAYCQPHASAAYQPIVQRPPRAAKDLGRPRKAEEVDGEPQPLDFERAA